MLFGSVTIATSFLVPLHFGHSSGSTPNVLRKSSAHGRYVPRLVLTPSGSPGSTFARGGATRERHGLAGASTPAYFTTWCRGGGTLAARRLSSDNGSISTATVPSR